MGATEVDRSTPHCTRVDQMTLAVSDEPWPFARDNRGAIERHWHALRKAKPKLFNGAVHLLMQRAQVGGAFTGRMLRTDYASFCYWHDLGLPLSAGVSGTGAAAILRAADGALMLGESAPETTGAGAIYLLSGVVDDQEVCAGGTIDIATAAMRELEEETGLTAHDVRRVPGFWTISDPAWVTFGIELVSPLPAAVLAERIGSFIARRPGHELTRVHCVSSAHEARQFGALSHAVAIAGALFGDETGT